MTRIEMAKDFAHRAHDSINQKRKYSGEPYWVHTDEVAQIVSEVPGATEDMVVAAHLHDVLEDVMPLDKTGEFQAHVIGWHFGEQVLRLVWELTDVYTKQARPGWNRAKRKEEEHKRQKGISSEAMTIKLADILSNTKSIVDNDPGFAKTYLREIDAILPHFTNGNVSLYHRVCIQVSEALEKLNIKL